MFTSEYFRLLQSTEKKVVNNQNLRRDRFVGHI